MATLSLRLAVRPEILAEPGAEGIQTHGNVQLGILTNDKGLAFSEQLLLIHEAFQPLYNLALDASPPSWVMGFLIQPLPPPVPYVPGPGAGPFSPIPGVTGVAAPLPSAPLDPVSSNALAASFAAFPGGFAHFSNPLAVHAFTLSGSVAPGMAPGLYRHDFYVTAAMDPAGASRSRVAKCSLALVVQRSDYP